MPLPTINDVQAVNPVLQNLLIGYRQSQDRFVAERVFPPVQVDKDSGTYYTLTKKYWFFDQMEERAPGNPAARTGFGTSTSTYTTIQWALAEPIADEIRANSQLALDLETLSVMHLEQANFIRKELAFSTDFMKTSFWGTSDTTTTDWDDFSAGDPVADALTAKRTISNSTGVMANSIVMGAIVDDAIRNHPDIIDRIKYVTSANQQNIESALAGVLGLQNYWVSRASYSNTNEAATFSASAIIDDDALICYVDPNAGVFGATAGKTFVWAPGGGTGTVDSYRDEDAKADIVRLRAQWDQAATATDTGYFFSDVV